MRARTITVETRRTSGASSWTRVSHLGAYSSGVCRDWYCGIQVGLSMRCSGTKRLCCNQNFCSKAAFPVTAPGAALHNCSFPSQHTPYQRAGEGRERELKLFDLSRIMERDPEDGHWPWGFKDGSSVFFFTISILCDPWQILNIHSVGTSSLISCMTLNYNM